MQRFAQPLKLAVKKELPEHLPAAHAMTSALAIFSTIPSPYINLENRMKDNDMTACAACKADLNSIGIVDHMPNICLLTELGNFHQAVSSPGSKAAGRAQHSHNLLGA